MPIYASHTSKRRTVKIISAGDTQIYLCPIDTIQLQATLNDYTNLRNYNIEWEQLTGPDVILTEVDKFTSTYPFSDTEDKKFRYYFDKGTPQEQYKEVNIYYTPTSVHGASSSNSRNGVGFTLALPKNVTEDPSESEEDFKKLVFDESDTSFSADFKSLSAVVISFEASYSDVLRGGDAIRLEVLSESYYTTVPNTVVQSYEQNNFPDKLILPQGVYRFRLSYRVEGIVDEATTNYFVSNPAPDEGYHAVNTQENPRVALSTLREITRYRNIIKGSISDVNIRTVGVASCDYVIRYKQRQYHNVELHSIKTSSVNNLLSLVRSDPTNIGND